MILISSCNTYRLPAALLITLVVSSNANADIFSAGILTSVEVYHEQTGTSTTTVRNYNAFDESFIEDGTPPFTALSVTFNGVSENINANPEYNNEYKRRQDFSSLEDMLSARPIQTDYSYNYTRDSIQGSLTNIGPTAVSFENAVPITPLFSISGVSGNWKVDTFGRSVFSYDPNSIDNFMLTLSPYSTSTSGGFVEYRYNVYDLLNNGAYVDGDGFFGPDNTLPESYAISLLNHSELDAGDDDPSTFGYYSGSSFEIEGEFFNHFNTIITNDGLLSSYVFGSVTSIVIQAEQVAVVPEPSTYSMMGLGLLSIMGLSRRRQKVG